MRKGLKQFHSAPAIATMATNSQAYWLPVASLDDLLFSQEELDHEAPDQSRFHEMVRL